MPIVWGASDPSVRGAICATLTNPEHRNAIGTHNGPYAIYRAVGVARGQIDFEESLDLSSTESVVKIGPYESWYDPEKIVAIDPWGHMAAKEAPNGPASEAARRGVDVQPTIAVSRANLKLIEVEQAVQAGRLKVDGVFLKEGFVVPCVKCAIEPVWWLPGIAKRFNLEVRSKVVDQQIPVLSDIVGFSFTLVTPSIQVPHVRQEVGPSTLGDLDDGLSQRLSVRPPAIVVVDHVVREQIEFAHDLFERRFSVLVCSFGGVSRLGFAWPYFQAQLVSDVP